MIGGATDGTIHIWNAKKHYSRADFIIEEANLFTPLSAVLSIVPSPCNPHLYASRGEDGTVRVWEIHKKMSSLKKPHVLRTFSRVENLYPSANVAFSPDGSLLCCGSSPPAPPPRGPGPAAATGPTGGKSMLYFFDLRVKPWAEKVPKEEGAVLPASLGVAVADDESAIFVQWQAKSNQIFCRYYITGTMCFWFNLSVFFVVFVSCYGMQRSTSAGYVRVFFDPRISVKGAVITAGRAPRREKDPSDYTAVGEIYNPHALPMYKVSGRAPCRYPIHLISLIALFD